MIRIEEIMIMRPKFRPARSLVAMLASCAALAAISTAAHADQVFADDVIVDGSLCVGFDCVNNESFGFTTIRMKENNTRLEFTDTSVGAFPTRDWRIEANSSDSGGPNHLAVVDGGNDGSGTTAVMTLTGGAPANSIFVASTGRVGLKTSTPALDLHLSDTDSPAIRLEQTSAGGFTAQTWDVAGNEANFFIRDVTGGSRLSFRIRPGAPTSSIDVASTGRVGLLTASPDAPLEIRSSASTIGNGNALIKLVNPDGPIAIQFDPTDDGTFWNLATPSDASMTINRNGNANTEFTLTDAGNLTISGTLTTGGPTCNVGCDAVFEPDYRLPSIEEHAVAMWDRKHLPNVEPVKPLAPVNLSERFGQVLNELETAHIYIEQLHKRIGALEASMERKAEN
jgi:hypothetical protein